jgi:methylated-DNA-protein-cysteine methyltransferase-like protein
VLKKLPANSGLPWHRVVNSQRTLSLPADSPAYRQQKQRLLAEGIEFNKEKIARHCFAWP